MCQVLSTRQTGPWQLIERITWASMANFFLCDATWFIKVPFLHKSYCSRVDGVAAAKEAIMPPRELTHIKAHIILLPIVQSEWFWEGNCALRRDTSTWHTEYWTSFLNLFKVAIFFFSGGGAIVARAAAVTAAIVMASTSIVVTTRAISLSLNFYFYLC